MNNEILFFINILVAGGCTVLCCRFGAIGLACWATAQGLLANIFVLKQIVLFGLNVTASDIFIISSMFSVTLLQELFDETIAQKTILASSLALLLFAMVSQLHLAYVPSSSDFAQAAYETLFKPHLRIILASIFAYWLSMQANLFLLRWIHKVLPKISLQLRTVLSLCIAQLLDTILFALLGLYGLLDNLEQIILFSFTIKLITLLLLSYCVRLIPAMKSKS
ncbi:MAG: hypothetical protein COC15_02180 [Legionellales bacterium]|nr:MAG: hypothetical protein COC15_02180 [Legionellales bacterium]